MNELFTESMTLNELRKVFLYDMVSYYSQDISRRSVNEHNTCYYRHPVNNNKCAIGRWIIEEKYDSEEHEKKTVNTLLDTYPDIVFGEILELGIDFLQLVQCLHDCDWYWDKNGLTHHGLKRVNLIKNEFIKD